MCGLWRDTARFGARVGWLLAINACLYERNPDFDASAMVVSTSGTSASEMTDSSASADPKSSNSGSATSSTQDTSGAESETSVAQGTSGAGSGGGESPPCVDEDLGSEVGFVYQGTNSSQDDTWPSSCQFTNGPGGGADTLLSWSAPDAGTYRFRVETSEYATYDAVLSLLEDCGGPEFACNDDARGSTDPTLVRDLQQGESVILVVDTLFSYGASSFGVYVDAL